ncbi:MAG: tripartite tricarboxylate transporter substrate binding protein [Comamonadaceae bacterium]|nr:MAG: tripartite tricarboxylate transporter substrate binding protein [Comamonadaceae bacterium]
MKQDTTLPGHAARRRTVLAAALGAFPALSAFPALAQQPAYPQGPVTFIVPWPPGGSLDIFARALGQVLSAEWGVPVIVDNKPGASGMIGADRAARAREDGQTILLANTTFIQAPALQGKAPYDPLKDFAPVTQLGTLANAFAVRNASPIRDINDYVRLLKAAPGRHSYASYGQASSAHLLMEGFKERQGLEATHVAYKGETAPMTDLLAGHIEAGFFSERLVHEQRAGVRALAVTGTQRSALLPDVPTFAEAGLAGMETVGWYGVFVPARTPRPLVARLSRDFTAALRKPEIQAKLRDIVVRPVGSTPEEFSAALAAEWRTWKTLIEKTGIRPE